MGSPWTVIGSLDEVSLEGVDCVVSDLDYTLTDFGKGHATGMAGLREKHGDRFAKSLEDTFQLILESSRLVHQHIWSRRGELKNLVGRMADRQACSEVHVRKWSRETWMQIASDRLGLGLAPQDVADARDLYWRSVADGSPTYEDAAPFLRQLEERRIPLVIMTASDSVMKLDADGRFRYDPDFALAYKKSRTDALPFQPLQTVIGDPYDKPHPRFFDGVDAVVATIGLNHRSRILAIGDSPHSDLEIPAQRGYETYHIKRG